MAVNFFAETGMRIFNKYLLLGKVNEQVWIFDISLVLYYLSFSVVESYKRLSLGVRICKFVTHSDVN